ncbi:phage holin family protein [Sagittula sp. NFXS13]|uniref:phage holin family protein n=1 Tax=Sagittula sp. NFXS13 TaxID=2819095 RepID=UPI0032DED106
MTHHNPSAAGIPAYIVALMEELRSLVRVELALAKAEMSRGAARMALGAVMLVVAAIFMFVALMVLSAAAVIALYEVLGWTLMWSVLTVGFSALGLAVILALVGAHRIKPGALVPHRAMANLRADLSATTEAPHAKPY